MAPALAAESRNAPLYMSHPLSKSASPMLSAALALGPAEQNLVDDAVDLGGLDVTPERRAELVKQVRARAEIGLMFVKNSGVEPELVRQLLAVSREFFSWAKEEKLALAADQTSSPRPQGYFFKFSSFKPSEGAEAQDPFPAFREQFRVQAYPEHAKAEPVVWPSEKLPEMQLIFDKYLAATRHAGEFLLGLLMEGLGLPPTYLQDRHRELGLDHKAIHTPVQMVADGVGQKPAAGLLTHSDPCLCNFDAADNRGLQYFIAGDWLTTPPLLDAVLFSIGDDLETISNGRYHSPAHRALTATESRISQATSLGFPDEGTVIGPAEEIIDSLHPARYHTRRARERVGKLTTALRRSKDEDRSKKHMFIDFDSHADKSKNMYVSHGQMLINGVSVGDWGVTLPAAA